MVGRRRRRWANIGSTCRVCWDARIILVSAHQYSFFMNFLVDTLPEVIVHVTSFLSKRTFISFEEWLNVAFCTFFAEYVSEFFFLYTGDIAIEIKWNAWGFTPPLCTCRLNWASWGWWDEWNDTVLQTQNSNFEPWRCEAEHINSPSQRLPQCWIFTSEWRRNIILFLWNLHARAGFEPTISDFPSRQL